VTVGLALLITEEERNRPYMLLLALVACALMDVNILELASVLNRKLHLLPELSMICL